MQQSRTLRACLALLFTCAAAWALAAEPKSGEADESWSVIYIGGSRVGYARSLVKTVKEGSAERVHSENEMVLSVKRFGDRLDNRIVQESVETADGDLLSFRTEMQTSPTSKTITVGRVEGEQLKLETTTSGKTTTSQKKWDKSVKSPAFQERLLKKDPLKPGDKRTFRTYMAELNQIAEITLRARDYEQVELLEGKKERLLRIDIEQSVLPGIVSQEYVDPDGESRKTSTGLLKMATYTVPRDEALKEIEGHELDLAVETLIKVKPIEKAHTAKRIVYRVRIRDEDPSRVLPSGPTQQIKKTGDGVAEVTVTAPVIPDREPAKSPAVAEEFRRPTQFLQSDDEEVKKHAAAAVGDERDPWRRALKMERYVHDKLQKKNFSTALASAGEVARSLEGDCTEHACLLAAMARAEGIPSRVVVGLVYASRLSAFGGHMWTEVFVRGQWIPLDATLGQGSIGAGHIKQGDSSFTDEGPLPVSSFLPLMTTLGKMEIEVVEVDK